ncbi:MAG: hypothetical protein Q4C42_06435 [Clostridia bacterium]|nr:hypothetical protein [Clostridia bacterium]
MDEKKMHEEELHDVTGGKGDYVEIIDYEYDSQGRKTHWLLANGTKYHYECPHCCGILHVGLFNALYCDPCDDYFTDRSELREVYEYINP